jgi:hypothetical protein
MVVWGSTLTVNGLVVPDTIMDERGKLAAVLEILCPTDLCNFFDCRRGCV